MGPLVHLDLVFLVAATAFGFGLIAGHRISKP